MQHSTTLTLKQTGLRGPINFNITSSTADKDNIPEAYRLMSQLASVWFQIEDRIANDDVDSDGNVEYTASFTLEQEEVGEPVYSKLEMFPKVSVEAEHYPRAFEAASYLAAVYLHTVGIIDDEGNVINETAFEENVAIDAVPATVH